MFKKGIVFGLSICVLSLVAVVMLASCSRKPQQDKQKSADVDAVNKGNVGADWVPVLIELPKPMFVGTPTNIKGVAKLEKPLGRARPPFYAPAGVTNLAVGKPVTGSEEDPIMGNLDMVTDGDKEAPDGSYVEMGPFLQYVTIDLEQEYDIYAVLLWHYHKRGRVYFDVVVQISKDPDFIDVVTIYNNDHDNSAGLGIGQDMHYVETNEGRLIEASGARGRYVRMYSNGNSSNDLNHYIEVEVFGK